MTSDTALVPGWTRPTSKMISGEALAPYGEGVLATGGENRAVYFPGDEFVLIVAGTLTLTDANSGDARTFAAGGYVFVPKGWQGSWVNEGFYRGVAVCSRDWLAPHERRFDDRIVDSERPKTFLELDPLRALAERGSDSQVPSGGHDVLGSEDVTALDVQAGVAPDGA